MFKAHEKEKKHTTDVDLDLENMIVLIEQIVLTVSVVTFV
jgi:hypothetical protein